MTIWRMRIACWTHMTTHSDSEYVILIAIPLQQCCTNASQRHETLLPLQMEQASSSATPVTVTFCKVSRPTRLRSALHALEQLRYSF